MHMQQNVNTIFQNRLLHRRNDKTQQKVTWLVVTDNPGMVDST